ncbi:MSP domain-containing protein [Nephila pilipes]|uniref:MSP domain-containing protein n=1 Tax=Nephila pilipes TaxID=299642 RepID=A0A8X6PGL5_NEPPI|nr:MSP domain-containing protein [Nephila pilipes]
MENEKEKTLTLTIKPEEFRLPFISKARATIVLQNKNDCVIHFNVATNSPETLRISQQQGCIEARKEAHIVIRRPKKIFATNRKENLIFKIKHCSDCNLINDTWYCNANPVENFPKSHQRDKRFLSSKYHYEKNLRPEDSNEIIYNCGILYDQQLPNKKFPPTGSKLPQHHQTSCKHHLLQRYKPNRQTTNCDFITECDNNLSKYCNGNVHCSCNSDQQKIQNSTDLKQAKMDKTFQLSARPYKEHEKFQNVCKNCHHCRNIPHKCRHLVETHDTFDDSSEFKREDRNKNTCCTHVRKKCKICNCDSNRHCAGCYTRSDGTHLVKRNFKILPSQDDNIRLPTMESKIKKRQDIFKNEEIVEIDNIDEQTIKTVRKRDKYHLKRKRDSKSLHESEQKNIEYFNGLSFMKKEFHNGLAKIADGLSGLSQQTVWPILKRCLNMKKISPLCFRCTKVAIVALAGYQPDRNPNEGDAFLQRIATIDEKRT